MAQTPHEDFDALLRRARALRNNARRWRGSIYRSAAPSYANDDDLTNGIGSSLHGGRWNPTGLPAVYGSLTPETAMAETLAQARYYNLPVGSLMPRVFVEVQVRLGRVLDIRDGEVRQRLRVSEERMLDEDWRRAIVQNREALTQALGRAVAEVGFEGLIAPSATPAGGDNLVVFIDQLLATSQVRAVADRGA